MVELAEITNRPPWEELGMTEKQFRALQHQARLELCRRDFWEFCKTLAPDFYMEGLLKGVLLRPPRVL